MKQCPICKGIFSKRQQNCNNCFVPLTLIKSHTKDWYNAHWGVDPSKLGLVPKEVDNPYYRKAPSMKLWAEPVVEEAMGYLHLEKIADPNKIRALGRRSKRGLYY